MRRLILFMAIAIFLIAATAKAQSDCDGVPSSPDPCDGITDCGVCGNPCFEPPNPCDGVTSCECGNAPCQGNTPPGTTCIGGCGKCGNPACQPKPDCTECGICGNPDCPDPCKGVTTCDVCDNPPCDPCVSNPNAPGCRGVRPFEQPSSTKLDSFTAGLIADNLYELYLEGKISYEDYVKGHGDLANSKLPDVTTGLPTSPDAALQQYLAGEISYNDYLTAFYTDRAANSVGSQSAEGFAAGHLAQELYQTLLDGKITYDQYTAAHYNLVDGKDLPADVAAVIPTGNPTALLEKYSKGEISYQDYVNGYYASISNTHPGNDATQWQNNPDYQSVSSLCGGDGGCVNDIYNAAYPDGASTAPAAEEPVAVVEEPVSAPSYSYSDYLYDSGWDDSYSEPEPAPVAEEPEPAAVEEPEPAAREEPEPEPVYVDYSYLDNEPWEDSGWYDTGYSYTPEPAAEEPAETPADTSGSYDYSYDDWDWW